MGSLVVNVLVVSHRPYCHSSHRSRTSHLSHSSVTSVAGQAGWDVESEPASSVLAGRLLGQTWIPTAESGGLAGTWSGAAGKWRYWRQRQTGMIRRIRGTFRS